jgi:hypothetical protein
MFRAKEKTESNRELAPPPPPCDHGERQQQREAVVSIYTSTKGRKNN